MTKIVDYIKAHPYIAIIKILGFLIALRCISLWYIIGYFCTLIIQYTFIFFSDAVSFFLIGAAVVFIIRFLSNIAAFIMVKKDISSNIIIVLSVLFGSLGAFIGTLFNREYKYTKVVKIIFNIQAWIFVCIVIPVFIYWFNYPIESPFVIYHF